MLNNDYVTPDAVRAATAPFVDAARYFTDGERPAAVLRRLAAARRLLLRRDRAAAGPSPSAAGAAITTASSTTTRSTSASACSTPCGRSASRPTALPRDGNQTIVWDPAYLSQRRARRPHRPRRGAEPGGLPDRQRHAAAGVRSVQPRRPPAPRRGHDLGLVLRRAEPQRLHLPVRQPAARRHLLPGHPRLLEHPDLERRQASAGTTRSSSRWTSRSAGSASATASASPTRWAAPSRTAATSSASTSPPSPTSRAIPRTPTSGIASSRPASW